MNSSLIYSIKLKQQTPMIHFQYHEDGATLRATEVKPKLDKFIINHCIENEIDYDNWLLGDKAHKALNYKMKIQVSGEAKITDNISKSYFGNMGLEYTEDGYKKTVFYHGDINLTILSNLPKLIKKINELIGIFFLLHNFGTRQNKGFGSFQVTYKNGTIVRLSPKEILSNYVKNYFYIKNSEYKYRIKKRGFNREKEGYDIALDDVKMIYGFMKSGYNFTKRYNELTRKMVPSDTPKDYFRGFIFRYFQRDKNGNIINDKAFIKQRILSTEHKNDIIGEKIIKGKEYRFVRAMLGLSGSIKFNHVNGRPEIFNYNKSAIERFQSPIFFKIIDEYIFIIPRNVPNEILDKNFYFSNSESDNEHYEPVEKEKIKTPFKFNTYEFLKEFAADFNKKDEKKGGEISINESLNNNLRRAKFLFIERVGE